MPVKQMAARAKQMIPQGILLRYRETDTPYGVTRRTASRLAKTLGMSETHIIHAALAQFARQNLPFYEPDDGPLTQAQRRAIDSIQPKGRMIVKESLF